MDVPDRNAASSRSGWRGTERPGAQATLIGTCAFKNQKRRPNPWMILEATLPMKRPKWRPKVPVNPTTELRKRRSTRIVQAVPLQVTGVDALGRPFIERTSSLILNCHGCRYQSKHYVLKNMWVKLEVPQSGSGPPAAHGTRPRRVDPASTHGASVFPGGPRTGSTR